MRQLYNQAKKAAEKNQSVWEFNEQSTSGTAQKFKLIWLIQLFDNYWLVPLTIKEIGLHNWERKFKYTIWNLCFHGNPKWS